MQKYISQNAKVSFRHINVAYRCFKDLLKAAFKCVLKLKENNDLHYLASFKLS